MFAGAGLSSRIGFRKFQRIVVGRHNLTTSSKGTEGTKSFRQFFLDEQNKTISAWHDIPLHSVNNAKNFNFITEIPRFTTPKMEIATNEENNPIKQDLQKDGKSLRNYCGPLYWNYGCLPQTWENPHITHPELSYNGDNDPLDVVEIGSKTLAMGSVTEVKLLGVLAMIDSGELDWKVIAIRTDDPMADVLHDVDDVNREFPHTINGIREWFRWYKVPDGKPLNKFGFDEKCLSRKVAEEIVVETHHYWKELVEQSSSELVAKPSNLWTPK